MTIWVRTMILAGSCAMSLVAAQSQAAQLVHGATSDWPVPQRQVFRGVRTGQTEMDLDVFDARGEPAAFIEKVRRAWTQRRSPILVEQREGWHQVIQADGDWVETVRVRQDPAAAPTLPRFDGNPVLVGERIRVRPIATADRIDDMRQDTFPDVLPMGARIVQRVGNRDAGARADTIVAQVQLNAEMTLDRLRANARRLGFDETASSPSVVPTGNAREMASILVRQGQSLAFTVDQVGSVSNVVLHWVR